ncbi:MAG: bifunctional 2-C-methyl-D-erythritol 4-phosphate cytidylyltransferase/2-C-methyl-D-erythritol 2,4-cyclodiphosphate synthase [Rhodospirillales bacterium]|nr:bifunctional 2-C-methyl-D-erythritol 4-phosphate cytidylyltransferase/2-C-methyl-D-erythritol 2,4-cyclodiphosphate synthase [Rhodospirillales bacterium]
MARCVALVVAAGRGTRLGGDVPKQYRELDGRPILRHSLAAFAAHPAVARVRAVIHPDDRDLYDKAAAGLSLLDPVPGGAARQDSVRLGLESLAGDPPDWVLIHDAARPFLSNALIDRVLSALERHPGAIPALPVQDTLKKAAGGQVQATLDRTGLYRAQTPQGFRYNDILAAHRAAQGQELTDDAAVAEKAGLAVALVGGDDINVKITTPSDFERAGSRLAQARQVRTASGFDTHRFKPGGDHLMLLGVRIPHEQGLDGYSDADVALHALTDALLGTIAAGDIGLHFPPGDPRWKGAPSERFLIHAANLIAAKGGRISHIDVTIICEKPKIGPHRARMIAKLCEILGLGSDQVSVKATTTEGLGFTGRKEGIAAQAMATIEMPALSP